MLEKILYFITPGPMTETFRFRARVFYSWISLGVILGLIIFVKEGIEGNTKDVRIEEYLYYLFVITSAVCLVALIGLGIDYVRKGNPEYQGWYWLLFPIITYLLLVFYFLIAIRWLMYFVGIFFLGIDIGKPNLFSQHKLRKIDPKQFRQQAKNLKLKDLLKNFDQQLNEINRLSKQHKLDSKQEETIRKIRGFDRSKYEDRLQDLLEEDEMEVFILLLLTLLGVKVR